MCKIITGNGMRSFGQGIWLYTHRRDGSVCLLTINKYKIYVVFRDKMRITMVCTFSILISVAS
jgi:hypothetical protein